MKKRWLSMFLIPLTLTLHPWPLVAVEKQPAPAASQEKAAPRALPFHGKLAAVDSEKKTFTVGKRVFHFNSETKILRDDKTIVLSQDLIGEKVGGAYVKDDKGRLLAVTVRLGSRPSEPDKPEKDDHKAPSS